MAERRMFSKAIIDNDMFLNMPLSAQALYFHLGMQADDDGFVSSPKKIQRSIGAADDDLKILITKQFVIPFDSGVLVIKHWKIHNRIQKDRYKETLYRSEKKQLRLEENNSYIALNTECTQNGNKMETDCIQDVYETETQVRLDKESIGKESIAEASIETNPATAAAISFYQTNIEPVTDFHRMRINDWLKKVDISLVLYAMEQAVSYGALKWSYVEKVLSGQFAKGHTTREQAENQTALESKEDTPNMQTETPIQTEFKYGGTY